MMMHVISDGFGEELSAYEGWLHARAHQMLPSLHPDHEDLVQEGRIAIWRATQTYRAGKGARPAWLTAHAAWHMKGVVSGRLWTGQPPRLKGRTALDPNEGHWIYLDDLMQDTGGVAAMLAEADMIDVLERAYHEGEVARALETLTPAQRRYVFARFWLGYQGKSLDTLFGYEPHGLWNSQKNGAKMKLHKQLEHLLTV